MVMDSDEEKYPEETEKLVFKMWAPKFVGGPVRPKTLNTPLNTTNLRVCTLVVGRWTVTFRTGKRRFGRENQRKTFSSFVFSVVTSILFIVLVLVIVVSL